MALAVVLVEDNAGDAFLLEKALQARHIAYELTRYEDGEQAVRALSSERYPAPDLILLDLNLPGREGFDVLRTVRMRPGLVGVPVGILTSSDAERDRHRVSLIAAERYIHSL
jgi:DNA-binding response OmpR family regulator